MTMMESMVLTTSATLTPTMESSTSTTALRKTLMGTFTWEPSRTTTPVRVMMRMVMACGTSNTMMVTRRIMFERSWIRRSICTGRKAEVLIGARRRVWQQQSVELRRMQIMVVTTRRMQMLSWRVSSIRMMMMARLLLPLPNLHARRSRLIRRSLPSYLRLVLADQVAMPRRKLPKLVPARPAILGPTRRIRRLPSARPMLLLPLPRPSSQWLRSPSQILVIRQRQHRPSQRPSPRSR
mmetsp:Transcript_27332/g.59850  ORF Transcript_27332/g.59850 Transcript_27332/m.59850 type:complete len:238 (+) Transcript_27332:257-970(+)